MFLTAKGWGGSRTTVSYSAHPGNTAGSRPVSAGLRGLALFALQELTSLEQLRRDVDQFAVLGHAIEHVAVYII